MNQKNDGRFILTHWAIYAFLIACPFMFFPGSSQGGTLIWSGGGVPNGNWNNIANWFGVGTPADGDTLVFQGFANSTNNIPNLTLNQIRFIGTNNTLFGYPITLTNSILATNVLGGVNTIQVTNITLATGDVSINVVGVNEALTIKSHILGAKGVVKTGVGLLTYNVPTGGNSYSGTTAVNAGVLAVITGGFDGGFNGPLVIGDGSGTAATLRLLLFEEIPTGVPITINRGGVFDLNGNSETVGNVTMQGGTIMTESTTLTMSGNITALPATVSSVITGNLEFTGANPTITVPVGPTIFNMVFLANVRDNGLGLQFTNAVAGGGYVVLGGSNTLSGLIRLDNLTVLATNSFTLGATNPVTVGGGGQLFVYSSSFTNKTLTLNEGAILTSQYNNLWTGPVILNGNVFLKGFGGLAFGTLNLAGPISGTGNITALADSGYWTLLLSGNQDNTFAGDLSMQVGTLNLGKTSGGFGRAIPNNLILGDGSHTATNRFLADNQIGNNSTVTLNDGSLMDLNNFFDAIETLVIYGATVTTGTGFLHTFSPGDIVAPQTFGSAATLAGRFEISGSILATNTVNVPAQIYTGSLTKAGPSDLFLQGSNTYAGLTVVQQGKVWLESPFALGTTNSGTVVSNGASLVLVNVGITNESLTLNGPGIGGVGGFGSLDVESGIGIWAGAVANNGASTLDAYDLGSELHINGPISGPGGLDIFNSGLGGGTIFFEGNTANTYAGLTKVEANANLNLNKAPFDGTVQNGLLINGTVRNLAPAQIDNSVPVTIGPFGLLDLTGGGDGVGSLDGSGSVNLGANFINSFGTGAHTYNGVISGSGAFYLSGAITYTLNGTNTYTGETHLYGTIASAVIINGPQPQSPVFVGDLATLGGSGVVGSITNRGTISPGNSPGILTCSNLFFNLTGNLKVELTGPNPGTGGYDQLKVRGTNGLANATLTVVPAFTTPVGVGQQFVIITNDASDIITGTFNGLPQGAGITVGNYKFAISYIGGSGNDVVLTLTNVPIAAVSSTVTAGDGSHGLDPNGCNSFTLVITNTTGSAMTGITATLASTNENVIITQPASTYANIPAHGLGTNVIPFQVSILPSLVCGSTITLQLGVNSSLGNFAVNYALNSGEAATVPSRYDITGNVGIPDVGTLDSTNLVAGFTSIPLQKVVVSLFITHSFDGDLTNISLVAPDGTTVLLSAANGGLNANYGSGLPDASRTIFDDAAGTSITSGSAPFVGTFRPQFPLSAFAGNGTPNGNWHLHIADGFGGASGILHGWSLFLYGTGCAAGGGACALCPDGTTYTNTLTANSAVESPRLFRTGPASTCGVLKSFPGTFAGSFNYHAYVFYNASSNTCITVTLNTISGGSSLFGSAYLGTFDPSNLTNNYLADVGGGGATPFSFNVPANTNFVVVVNAIAAVTGTTYNLTVSGGDCTPVLSIARAGVTNVGVTWPTVAGGYNLQATPGIDTPAWSGITNEPLASGNLFHVTNSMTPTNRFYRLQKP